MSTWRDQVDELVWTVNGLRDFGFRGFVPFAELPASSVPTGPGVYAVVRRAEEPPAFRPESGAGWFKSKRPVGDRGRVACRLG